MKNTLYKLILTSTIIVATSCSEDWLEVKRDRSLIVPSTLKDLSLLLNDATTLAKDYIALSEISSDSYFLSDETWQSLATVVERNGYIWKEDIYEQTPDLEDWDKSYTQILTANVILAALQNIEKDASNQQEWNRVKGESLALRGRAFYNLSQLFAETYDPATASSDAGIPIRLTADVNASYARATVQETYDRITQDLSDAAEYLSELPDQKLKPSKASVFGLMARCYLNMRDYQNAKLYAEKSLSLHHAILDYNTLDTTELFPFVRDNAEVIHHSQIEPTYSVFIFAFQNYVDLELYDSYDENDLRKKLLFYDLGNGHHSFKGSYSGDVPPFSGIAVDELMLIRAECLAREGNVESAMSILNELLINRYVTGTFVPLTASDAADALRMILLERKKELVQRGLRWSDLKRLNADPAHAKTLTRELSGQVYTLPPNDPRYTMPIPEYVIQFSGIPQNDR
jgi:tetratricopeptide (TPR) repeat protein